MLHHQSFGLEPGKNLERLVDMKMTSKAFKWLFCFPITLLRTPKLLTSSIVLEAARICIHLGLHREPPPGMILNTLELDTRSRLFWTTYGIERP
jgi:hypothetical protein